MMFGYCYGLVDEVGRYQTNHREDHIQTALEFLDKLDRAVREEFTWWNWYVIDTDGGRTLLQPETAQLMRLPGRRPVPLMPGVGLLKVKFPWFRLEQKTEAVLNALETLAWKLRDRLQDKKDLQGVRDLLADLAGYLYSRIPGILPAEGAQKGQDLEAFGDDRLISFVKRLLEIPDYMSQPKPVETRQPLPRRLRFALLGVARHFTHENVLICFIAWYFLSLALTLLCLRIAFYAVPGLKMDSALVTLIVGAPLATAAAGLVASRPKQSGK